MFPVRNFIGLVIAFFLPLMLFSHTQHSSYFDDVEMPRIAIIGGGIGGATAAYKLKQLFGSQLSSLDVYEANQVGGRLRTVTVNNFEYEVGGSVIHPANQHMVQFAKLLGLSHLAGDDGNFAMFNGQKKVMETSTNSWLSTLQLLWKYGLDLIKMGKSTDSFLADFDRIYKWQEEHQSFTTVPNLLMAMSDEIMNATKISLREFLFSQGISKHLTNELGLAAARNNYGQTPDNMHGLVGSVSLAGAQPNLWSVKGGNYKVPQLLLETSNTRVTKTAVTKVSNISTDAARPLYRLHMADGSTAEYDVVLLAFPFRQDQTGIQFVGFDTDFSEHQREYHILRVYVVEGVPNHKHFGYDNLDEMPDTIFPIGDSEFYNTLAEIFPVSGEKPSQRVWKVFSNNILTNAQLDDLFISRKSAELVEWFAYPQYKPAVSFVPFVVAPKIYYINAIELAASAMEMSALSAVNAAYLVVHEWMAHDHLIDNMFVIEDRHLKLEL